jgi:predicted GNAT superfamily acetyltransferase
MTHPTEAAEAARAAGVSIREISEIVDLESAFAVFDEIWHPAPDNPPVTVEVMRALATEGGYVAGVFDADLLVGASVGFCGPPRERSLHSHIAGVSAAVRGRSVGRALKLHQRAWALDRGIAHITWTFDPLVRRNAWFNLARLGAVPVRYMPNFYGGMSDAINADDESDRLLVRWDLEAAAGAAPGAGGGVVALTVSPDGFPEVTGRSAPVLLVGLPADIESLRGEAPDTARAWRFAVRDTLGTLMAAGGRVVGFDRDGGYVVSTTQEGERS